jgi:hypothetical protein
MIAVVEDGEVLTVQGEVLGGAGPRQGVREVVRREARLPVLAVGDERLAGRLQPLDRVLSRLVLGGYELLLGDLALVVVGVGFLNARPPVGSPIASASSRAPSFFACSAASWSPSPAATIEPFIRTCHSRAKPSASGIQRCEVKVSSGTATEGYSFIGLGRDPTSSVGIGIDVSSRDWNACRDQPSGAAK